MVVRDGNERESTRFVFTKKQSVVLAFGVWFEGSEGDARLRFVRTGCKHFFLASAFVSTLHRHYLLPVCTSATIYQQSSLKNFNAISVIFFSGSIPWFLNSLQFYSIPGSRSKSRACSLSLSLSIFALRARETWEGVECRQKHLENDQMTNPVFSGFRYPLSWSEEGLNRVKWSARFRICDTLTSFSELGNVM